MINQWEIISPLVDKINSIGTELEEIIVEQLIPKFNQIEKESDKTEVIKIITFHKLILVGLIRRTVLLTLNIQHTTWLENFVKLQDEYEELKSDLKIDLDNIDLKAGYDSIHTKSSILLDQAKRLAE